MRPALSSNDLELVRVIADTGSLTRTAKLMHVSQPAISQRLANLQDRLGARLFLRSDGQMRPTEAARRLAEAAVAVDSLIDSAERDVAALLDQRQRQFRLTAQCHTSYRWLSFVIRDLVAAHPGINVDVVPEAVEDPFGAAERDEVDIALVFTGTAGSAVRNEPVFEDELFAVMHKDHPFASRRFLTPQNFADEALVLYTGKRHAFIDLVLAPAGVVPGRLRQVRMTEAIVELARAGQGIAVLAGWVLNDIGSRDDLAAVRITRGGYRRQWRALIGAQCPAALEKTFLDSARMTGKAIAKAGWRQVLEVD